MGTSEEAKRSALIVGVTGIVGGNLAAWLAGRGWSVFGLSRSSQAQGEVKMTALAADLREPASLRKALEGVEVSHVFLTSWLRQATERENIAVNGAMVRNLLDVLSATSSGSSNVKHVSLVTGLKHYLGPFEAYGKGALPATPFRETQPRLAIDNFYYAQEDELFAAAKRDGFSWSVHRPHTIVGYALGNAMNMGVTLAVYASLCKATGHPFRFPGSAAQWNGLTDMTDARLLAKHLEWASVTDSARNQAFNVVNGDVFRWSWMWARLADYFKIEAAPFTGEVAPLETQLPKLLPAWPALAKKHNLQSSDANQLVSAWHTDADLGRPIEVIADMTKSRKLGFTEYQSTEDSFVDLFNRLRADRIIP